MIKHHNRFVAAVTVALLAASVATVDASAAKPRAKAVKTSPIELFRQAENAADEYRFAEAAELLEKYDEALPRRGKAPVSDEELQTLTDRIERGRLMMDRVEKIVVIDSIAVPRAEFFAAYRLDPAAGTLLPASALPDELECVDGTSVFVPESGQMMMWAAPDSTGRSVIAELSLLADGSYEPVVTHPELNIGVDDDSIAVNAMYPFMMADGLTLYYAMDNPELSIGGYDIFFTRRDGDTFMQPQNMGMPYNSPANDYLLAIDEATGTGWWATDRNSPDSDSLTIYRFIPNELRVNYRPDETPDLPSLARLDSYKATQPAGADYTELLAKPLNTAKADNGHDFRIAVPGRGVISSLDDIRSSQGRKAVKEWLSARDQLAKSQMRLARLRADYRSGKQSVSTEILDLERRLPQLRKAVADSLNNVVRAESR